MTKITAIEFSADLTRDDGVSSKLQNLGRFYNRMEYRPEHRIIIWNYGKDAPDEDETVIGIQLEDNVLVDYDGLYSIPEEAMRLLELNGINVDEMRTSMNS